MDFLQIKETCLYVKDLQLTKDFYTGKLGLDCIAFEKDRHVFFRAGSSVLLCFIAESTSGLGKAGLPPHAAEGNIHFALEVDPGQYDAVKKELHNKGIIIEHEQQWKKDVKSVYFRDPDCHLVEIIPKGLWK